MRQCAASLHRTLNGLSAVQTVDDDDDGMVWYEIYMCSCAYACTCTYTYIPVDCLIHQKQRVVAAHGDAHDVHTGPGELRDVLGVVYEGPRDLIP